jgi:hypothetical protein
MGFENGHLVRVVLSATASGGRDQVHTLHYDLQGGVPTDDPNDPQLLADAFRDDVMPAYRALFNGGWTIQPVIVEDERDPQDVLATRQAWTSGSAAVGTRGTASNDLPPGICGVATLLTEHIGRRYRGRIFLGGTLVEDDQDAGNFSSGIIALWQAFLDAIPRQPDIVSGASSSSARWCVYSRTQRAANLDPYASAITGTIIRSRAHYLRSRAT